MKNFIFLLSTFTILTGCVQEPVRIVYNDKKIYSKNDYATYNYNKGAYKKSPDGRIVRDITLKEDDTNFDKTTKNNDNNYDYVTVQPEDSLYRIAKNNNIELEKLAKINNINKPYNINVGQKIMIPKNKNGNELVTNNTSNDNIKQDNKGYHIVKKGETLYSISKAYNIDMDEIIKINNLQKPYNLSLNQKLIVSTDKKGNELTKANTTENKNIATNNTEKSVEKVENTKSDEFAWPLRGEIIKKFGDKVNEVYHDGINIKASKGTEIKASKSGEVAYSGNELKGYGNIVILRHSNNWLTIYAHCDELKVKQGDNVKQGDVIATVGSTGNVSEEQLYFSIREGREAKDPIKFLK